MGIKGLVWSASAMGVCSQEGIGDTIRISLTPRPGGDRRDEVYACIELLQALDMRQFVPSVTACPGCGRTTIDHLPGARRTVEGYVREQMPIWKESYEGVEEMSRRGHGLRRQRPGRVEGRQHRDQPARHRRGAALPVYIDGQQFTNMQGTYEELYEGFRAIIDDYVDTHYGKVETPTASEP